MKLLRTKLEIDMSFLSNLPVIIGLILLGSSPLFLLEDDLQVANQLAGYAYYFLIVGILWKIILYLMNRYRHEDEFKTLEEQS